MGGEVAILSDSFYVITKALSNKIKKMESKKEEKRFEEAKEHKTQEQKETKKSDENDELKKQLEEKTQKIEELTDTLKRLQAEFENFKKWVEREKSEFVKYAHADLIGKMLPVFDSLELSLNNTADKEKLIEGIKLIFAQLHSVLESEGLKPIKAVGEKFDPYRHEVLMKQESDKPDDTILEEFQKGYTLHGRILRHSKVKVSGK